MTRIVGLQGSFKGDNLISILNSFKNYSNLLNEHVYSGIFLSSDNNHIYNDKLCDFNSENDYIIGLGSNYSKSFKKTKSQPICYKNLILVFDGFLYNSIILNDYLKNFKIDKEYGYNSNNSISEYVKFYSDLKSKNVSYNLNQGILLAKLIYKNLKSSTNLKEAIIQTMQIIDGEYAFGVFDGKNLVLARDEIGIKPLYYHINNNYIQNDPIISQNDPIISQNDSITSQNSSIEDNHSGNIIINSFSSERKALWKMGIKDSEIKQLKPGYILYNWKLIAPKSNPWDLDYIKDNDFNIPSPIGYDKRLKSLNIEEMNYNQIKYSLLSLITDSTYKRVFDSDEVGVIFSGGVDSTILATLLKNFSDDISVNLYTVGVKESKDLEYAKKTAKNLNIPLKTEIINENLVRESLTPVLNAIEEPNLMKIGVGMTLYLATKLAFEDGIKITLAGQGADEIFGGYNRYLTTYKDKGPQSVEKNMINDIKLGYDVNFERDDKIANLNNVDLRVPYLDENLVNFALKIPVKYKINSNEDLLRKRILRDIAIDIGIDKEIAERPKKAAQYGSGIHKILIKKVLKDIDLNELMNEIIESYNESNDK